jgi:phosphate starvation-inducible protein PhoH and related proteins
MAKPTKSRNTEKQPRKYGTSGGYKLEFLNPAQKLAWATIDKHDVCFLIGPAGTGKTQLATAYAISQLISGDIRKIFITRPIVEAEEKLGFLPGTFEEKVHPYMLPIFDCIETCVGKDSPMAEKIKDCLEVAPLAYMRGRTLKNAVCILDEAQNCTRGQIKLFLSRLGLNSKMIVTGDPRQSDLKGGSDTLYDVAKELEDLDGVGMVWLKNDAIVRHPLVGKILDRMERDGEHTL